MSNKDNSVHNYFIQPGYIYLPVSQTKISAVLGSSAAVAIYDKSKKTGGMTHFLYPEKLDTDKPRAIYGDVSTLTLIKMLLAKGSKKNILKPNFLAGLLTVNTQVKILEKAISFQPEKYLKGKISHLRLKILAAKKEEKLFLILIQTKS